MASEAERRVVAQYRERMAVRIEAAVQESTFPAARALESAGIEIPLGGNVLQCLADELDRINHEGERDPPVPEDPPELKVAHGQEAVDVIFGILRGGR